MAEQFRGGTLRRALALVTLLEAHRFGVTVHDVAKELECETRTAYRWLREAEAELGLLYRRGQGGSAASAGRWRLAKYEHQTPARFRAEQRERARDEAAARNAAHFGTDPSWYGR